MKIKNNNYTFDPLDCWLKVCYFLKTCKSIILTKQIKLDFLAWCYETKTKYKY